MGIGRRSGLVGLVVGAALGTLALACGSDDAGDATSSGGPTPASSSAGGPVPIDPGPSSSSSSSGGPTPPVDPPYTGPRAKLVVGSDSRTCALMDAGDLRCWGAGKGAPETITPGKTYKTVALGRKGGACAIETNGALWCWTTEAPTPVAVAGGPWSDVAIGDDQRCAVKATGALVCWGENGSGQLGVGDLNARTEPTQVGDQTDWSKVAAGERWSCALKTDGHLFCWGFSSVAGGDPALSSQTPVAIAATSTFKDVALYSASRVVVRSDGAWMTGTGTGLTQIGKDTDWVEADLGGQHRCARKTNGSVWCVGKNTRGQVGDGSASFQVPNPVQVASPSPWTSLAAGESHTCAVRSDDGSVRCWGAATRGQLGHGGPVSPRTAPSQVGTATDWAQITSNQLRTCGTRKDGSVWCWGGGIAAGTDIIGIQDVQEPKALAAAAGSDAIELGLYTYCVRKAGNVLACWGSNGFGEAGIGSTTPSITTPTAVALGTKAVSIGISHACAIDTADAIYCWGSKNYNQLGFASDNDVRTPTLVNAEGWKAIASTYSNNCAVKNDGSLYCFGYSFTGFERIGADVGWTAVVTTPNDNEYFGIRDGVAYKWSGNGGSKVPYAYPGTSGAVAIAANFSHQCVVKNDGTMWCLGTNGAGELGDGTTTYQASAVQVGTSADWKAVATGYTHTCGIRTNGTLWCWGSNGSGEIGDGTSWSTTPRLAKL